MKTSSTRQAAWRRLAFPVVGLCVGYWAFCDRPLSQILVSKLAKLREVTVAAERITSPQTLQAQLDTNLATEQTLKSELQQVQQRGARLVASRADRRAQWLPSAASATTMSNLVEMFQQHQIECLESTIESIDTQNPPAHAPVFLKSLAGLLDDPSLEKAARREIRVKLRGRFEDMRSAFHEMQAALTCVFVVSLEMEPEIDGWHVWKLILLV